MPRAVERPALFAVDQIGDHHLVQNLVMHGRIFDRGQEFNAPVEVARHPVSRTDIDFGTVIGQRLAIAEHGNAAMLQKTADHRLDPDMLRHARHAGAQATDAPHDQVDLHPGIAGGIEFFNQRRIDQAVHLGPDGAGATGADMVDLGIHHRAQMIAQAARGHDQLFQPLRLNIAGDIVEQRGGIPAEGRIGGEEAQIGIDAGRDRMIIAGAKMAVAAKLVPLAPDHHRHFGVGFPVDEAIDDLHAGPLQRVGPHQVLLFVEPRLQFDHGGHGLARLRRVDQRADDRGLFARAIERLLDRHHIRIDRRLLQERHDDVERLIGMVDDNILRPDRGETIAAIFTDAFGKARRIGFEFQVWPILLDDAGQVADADEPFHLDHHGLMALKHVLQHLLDRFGDALFYLHADDAAPAAALDRAAIVADQILGLFLDLDVAVADDAEHAAVAHHISGEQIHRKTPHHRLQRHVTRRFAGNADKACKRCGDHHQLADRLLVRQALQVEDDRQALIGDEGKGMGRVQRLRRQDRENLVQEMVPQPGFAQRIDRTGRADHFDAHLRQLAMDDAPHLLLRLHQPVGFRRNGGQLLPRGQPVGRTHVHVLQLLALEARDPDGEEFVQIGAGDRQEAQPLQQRMGAVHRLLQHALVERQPGQLTVEIATHRLGQAGRGIGFGHWDHSHGSREGSGATIGR